MHWSLLFLVGLVIGCHSFDPRGKRQAVITSRKWTNNQMNFFFAPNFPLRFEAMFRDAMEYIEAHTCIQFYHDASQLEDFKVRIQYVKENDQCFAYFGERNSNLYFGYTCAAFGVAVHELMHTLGIAHAQSRTDRNDYLVVNSDDFNDDINDESVNLVPWDYGSVMLYERSNKSYPKDPEYNYTMGSLRVAFYDMLLINKFYDCNCNGHKELQCQNGGYQNPAKCSECICTDGFGGDLCEKHDGIVLEASEEWEEFKYWMIRRKDEDKRTKAEDAVFVITAPPGTTIEAQITKLSGFFCQTTCDYNGVEIKYKKDRRMTSPLICCDNDNLWNKTRTTTDGPMVIVKYGNNKGPVLMFRYRYVNGTEGADKTADKKVLDNRIDQD